MVPSKRAARSGWKLVPPVIMIFLLFRRIRVARFRIEGELKSFVENKSSTTSTNSFSYVSVPIPVADNPTTSLQVHKSELPRRVYLLNSTQQLDVIAPYNSNSTRSLKLERVSVQARRHHCVWAVNGGPFHRDGSTAGALIIDGKVIIDDFGGASGFGVTAGPSPQWILGPVSEQDVTRLGIVDYVTGFDWLVYNGHNVATKQQHMPAIKRAPRTAVGVDKFGNLILMVADGCERW